MMPILVCLISFLLAGSLVHLLEKGEPGEHHATKQETVLLHLAPAPRSRTVLGPH